MRLEELLEKLECVKARSNGRWSARCPAHADKNPSLSIAEGNSGLLLKCFAGCSSRDICEALGLRVADLFYEIGTDRRSTRAHRDQKHHRELEIFVDGLILDAVREAEQLILSAKGIDISDWTPEELDQRLNELADAHHLLECENSA